MPTDLILSVPGGDIDVLRRAADVLRGLDPDLARVAAAIDARLAADPDDARRRRDAAIVALAADFPARSVRAQAEAVAQAIDRYAASSWKYDKPFGQVKAQHRATRRALLFAVMRACGDRPYPEVDRIRQILSHCCDSKTLDNSEGVAISHSARQPNPRTKRRGGPGMNILNDNSKFLDQVRKHPIGLDVIRDENRRLTAERESLVEKVAAIETAAPKEAAEHGKAVKAATAKVHAAEAEWRQAQGALREALAAESSAAFTRTFERQRLEDLLRQSADNVAIDAFLGRLHDEAERVRKVSFETEDQTAQPSALDRLLPMANTGPRVLISKAKSVWRRLKAIRASREDAEALRYIADQTAVPARMEAIFAGLPPIVEERTSEEELQWGWQV